MKIEKFLPIFLVSVVLFFISFIMGYQLMKQNINIADKDSENNDFVKAIDPSDVEITKEEKVISPNAFIEKRIHYTLCGHTEIENEKVKDEYVNMNRSEFENYLEENYSGQIGRASCRERV